MELLKLLSASEIAAQLICFFIVFFLLKKFAWKSLLGLLDARRERIAEEFRRIEGLENEVKTIKLDYLNKIRGIEDAAQARITEAVKQGDLIAEEIRQKAQEDARSIAERAQEHIQLEVVKAKEELKKSIVSIAMDATEKIIQEVISPEREKALVEEFLREVEKVK